MPRAWKGRRYLHIHESGREIWFRQPHYLWPTLAVECREGWQYTRTYIRQGCELPPHGERWQRCDPQPDSGSVEWRRPHRRGVNCVA
jgi:hypothetical protein